MRTGEAAPADRLASARLRARLEPPAAANSTSFWYSHTNQWRYEKLAVDEIVSPLAPEGEWETLSLIDFNVRSERMLAAVPAA